MVRLLRIARILQSHFNLFASRLFLDGERKNQARPGTGLFFFDREGRSRFKDEMLAGDPAYAQVRQPVLADYSGKSLEKKRFWSINPDTIQNRLASTPDSDRLEHILNI
jgi:hypothetical protein